MRWLLLLVACNRAPLVTNQDMGGSCASLSEAACSQSTTCHALYDVQMCKNAQGYCANYVGCMEGPGNCLGPTSPGICPRVITFCAGPYVVSYGRECAEGCIRASQCSGCVPSEHKFTQADGCANDGSLEFCIPTEMKDAVLDISPQLSCAPGGGRARCDSSFELLCFYPTTGAACVSERGALSDEAYAELCQLSTLPAIDEIVRTFFE